MLVCVRDKATKQLLASAHLSGYVGPTYISRWIERQATAASLKLGEYQWRMGKKGAWTS